MVDSWLIHELLLGVLFWLAVSVGERTLAMAQRLVHRVVDILAKDCRPLFLTEPS